MIELDRHIEILLLSNDCVIVPDLGGFMAHHVDARYDEQEATFLPPLRTLGFNPKLKLNDSLLVQSYIEAYDLSYPEALRRIETEVSELRQHLESDGEYELNDIGILRLNDEGNLQFEPCEAGILTPELYGLASFEMKPLELNEPKAEADEVEDTDDEPSTEHALIIKMSWLRNIVAVAAAVLAFLMITTPVSNSRHASGGVQQSAFFPIGNKAQPADSASSFSAETTDEEAAETSETDNAATTDAPVTAYCIVMASHVSERGALNFVEQLKQKGYTEARMTVNDNNVRRVVFGTYASESEAQEHLNSLRNESKHFRESWIMQINN